MGIQERKEREKENRREAIIDAAEKIFFEKGLMVATMDEIADLAELGKSTLYVYYRSKEDLYLAVLLRGTDIMYDMFSKALSTGEPTLKLIANLGEAYYEYFKLYRNYFRMFYFFENPQLHTQVSEEMQANCTAHNGRIWQLIIDLIQRGIDEGVLQRGLDPKQVAVILWSNSNGLMRQMDRTDDYWKKTMGIDLEEALRRSNSLLVEAMMTEKAKREYHKMVA
jgi:TetR/AcrR family transcriptional regulator